jgi:uncharacterized cupin superfamily protein
MDEITVEKPEREKLDEMGVFSWPIWEKEVSEFEWFYDSPETFYVLEGEVEVEPAEGQPVRFGPGSLVTMPEGLGSSMYRTVPGPVPDSTDMPAPS